MSFEINRRDALLGVAASAFALAHASAAHAEMAHGMDACIAECERSKRACLETARYCLEKGGSHAKAAHVRLLLDCAEICQTTANFMLRGSPLHGTVCESCAEICDRCAESCEAFQEEATLKSCAEVCRTCAKSCREMARM